MILTAQLNTFRADATPDIVGYTTDVDPQPVIKVSSLDTPTTEHPEPDALPIFKPEATHEEYVILGRSVLGGKKPQLKR